VIIKMKKFLLFLFIFLSCLSADRFTSNAYGAITFDNAQDLTAMTFYDASAGTWTTRNLTTGDYFDDDSAVGDYIAFAWDRGVWHDLSINVGTQLVADTITLEWEYMTATATWATLTVTDNTNSFQNAGVNTVTFDVPDSWYYKYKLDGATYTMTGCYIRARITAITNISEGGAQQTNVISSSDWAISVADAGTRLSDIQTADTAGGWGVTTTTGKYTAITSNIRIATNGELFIRDNEFLEIGSLTKRRTFLKPANTLFQMGDATSGYSEGSMMMYWNNDYVTPYNRWYGNIYIYNSTITKYTGGYNDFYFGGAVDIRNSVLATTLAGVWFFAGATGTLENVTIDERGFTWFYLYSPLTINNLILADVGGVLAGTTVTVSNIDFGTDKIFRVTNANYTGTLVNCNFDTSFTSQVAAPSNNNTAIVQYIISLTIIDENGDAIPTPTVQITNAEGTDEFNGEWAGDINVTVWQEHDGDETDYNPFTITVTKTGYRTYTGIVTIDKKTDWDVILDTGDTVIYDSTIYDSTIY